MNRNGIAGIGAIIALLIAIVVVGTGGYILTRKPAERPVDKTIQTESTTPPTETTGIQDLLDKLNPFDTNTETKFIFNNDLSFGMQNDTDVKELQKKLTSEGCYAGAISGNFDEATREAVKCFQRKYKFSSVPASGSVGTYTRKVLNEGVSVTSTPTPAPKPAVVAATSTTTTTSTTPSVVQTDDLTITACREIIKPGNYVLGNDIINSSSYSPCLNVHDTSNVRIDFNNHYVDAKFVLDSYRNTGLSIKNVDNFTVTNCVLKGQKPQNESGVPNLIIWDSKDGNIVGCNSSAGLSIDRSSTISITNSSFNDSAYIDNSEGINIENNTFLSSNPSTVIEISEGKNNKIVKNSINGKSDGVYRGAYSGPSNLNPNIGADEGIFIRDETNITIQDNIISDVWDCGIESGGYIFDSKIIDNKITNAGFCGIGGWWWSSVKGNTFDGNIVDNSPKLFYFFRASGIENGHPAVYFKDNVFSNNKLTNQRSDNTDITVSWISTNTVSTSKQNERPVTEQDLILGNNILTNNNFGINFPVYFAPKSMIVDGGGNICKQSSEADYPLRCSQ